MTPALVTSSMALELSAIPVVIDEVESKGPTSDPSDVPAPQIDRKQQKKDHSEEVAANEIDQKFKALEFLLNKSKLYSKIILDQLQRKAESEEADAATAAENANTPAPKPTTTKEVVVRRSSRTAPASTEVKGDSTTVVVQKRTRAARGEGRSKESSSLISEYFKKKASAHTSDVAVPSRGDDPSSKAETGVKPDKSPSTPGSGGRSIRQPKLITGGTMRDYQLDGLEWLTSLYENGLNGILADEMGLGKTLITISFLAFLWERQSYGPTLIVAPLSTTSNWIDEIQKWAPELPCVLYHGTKSQRMGIRKKRFGAPGTPKFPIVVTSYEICMNDRSFLSQFGWKYIIIDEGHRLKNLNCRLIRDLQSFKSSNRLLITGTPLQNNLSELWSLLHFLMPSIFDSLDAFESWFDFTPPANSEQQTDDQTDDQSLARQLLSQERQKNLVDSLHAILRPFLLRRIKADVEIGLPKKREYVLYVPLSAPQRTIYTAIQAGAARDVLEKLAVKSVLGSKFDIERDVSPSVTNSNQNPQKRKRSSSVDSMDEGAAIVRRSRRLPSMLPSFYDESGAIVQRLGSSPSSSPTKPDLGVVILDLTKFLAKKYIGAKKLQNPVMQLRLCCDSPYNFFNPYDLASAIEESFLTSHPNTKANKAILSRAKLPLEPDERLVTTSGKMSLLDQLLKVLIPTGHKVLIFSQFTTQLDLIEAYATQLRGWGVCRIDGSVSQTERHKLIKAFNRPKSDIPQGRIHRSRRNIKKPEKVDSEEKQVGDDEEEEYESKDIFLLSTRAGGQGITLTAADSVILFDSDWNPQQDLQAQDRAHRIGQTRNVIVYRFASTLSGSGSQAGLDVLEASMRSGEISSNDSGLQTPTNSSILSSATNSPSKPARRSKYLTGTTTVEQSLLNHAGSKRRLEKLVIQKGGLTRAMAAMPKKGSDGTGIPATPAESMISKDDFPDSGSSDVDDDDGTCPGLPLSQSQLDSILDRSEEAYHHHARRVEESSEQAFNRLLGNNSQASLGAEVVICRTPNAGFII